MSFTPQRAHRLVIFLVTLATVSAGSHRPTRAQSSAIADTKIVAPMLLMNVPKGSAEVVLKVWDKTDQIHTTLLADSLIQGKCIHCNVAMSFKADRASARCSVCPCSASFAECLTGKGNSKTSRRDMIDNLAHGTALRVELIDPNKPDSGIKLLEVDPRSVLLPLTMPLVISDSDFLAIVKSIGALTVERADSGGLLRLTIKDDWTNDKASRMTKILANHGIDLDYSAAAAPQLSDSK